MTNPPLSRRYTAAEIVQMRRATRELAEQDGAGVDENGITFRSISYEEIELLLRTYLLAGIEPDDLTNTAAANLKALWDESDRLESGAAA